MNQNTRHSLRTVSQRIKIVGFMLLFIVFIGNTQLTDQQAYAQGAICADRPVSERGIPPSSIWVELETYYGEWGEIGPIAKEVTFDFYIAGVLLGELGDSPDNITNANLPSINGLWADAALEALAVAVRSFTWFRLNYAGQFPDPYDPHAITLDNTNQCGFWDEKIEGGQQINAQTFRPYQDGVSQTIRDHYNVIVTQHVPNIYMVEGNGTHPIDAQYRATVGVVSDDGNKPYLIPIHDPISAGDGNPTNASGMGQWGAQRWAMGLSDNGTQYQKWESYQQILTHYYTGIHLRDTDGNRITPEYRWNAHWITWYDTGNILPPPMVPGNSYTFYVSMQNTGVFSLTSSTRWAYQWKTPDGVIVSQGNAVSGNPTLDPGDSMSFGYYLPVQPPTTPGTYHLLIDIQVQNGQGYEYFYNREPNRPWYPVEYVCVIGNGDDGDIYLPIVMKNS